MSDLTINLIDVKFTDPRANKIAFMGENQLAGIRGGT